MDELNEIVLLQCHLREGARRYIRSEAAKQGITMGEYLTRLLEDHAGYRPEQKAA